MNAKQKRLVHAALQAHIASDDPNNDPKVQEAFARAHRATAPALTSIVKEYSRDPDDNGPGRLEGIYGPCTHEEAERIIAEFDARPRWERAHRYLVHDGIRPIAELGR